MTYFFPKVSGSDYITLRRKRRRRKRRRKRRRRRGRRRRGRRRRGRRKGEEEGGDEWELGKNKPMILVYF